MTRRIRTFGLSPLKRRSISKSHCLYWRWHHLAVAFVALVGFGIALGASVFTVPHPETAVASGADNVMGWAWTDPIGWISMNNMNPAAGGGTYGVNVDLATGELIGYAWSDNAGWICFGNSCSVAACTGVPPASVPPYNARYAKLDPAPYSVGATIRYVHGWGKVCNESDLGWISLNCHDLSAPTCGTYEYHVAFDMSTHQFQDLSGVSFGWNGNSDLSGFGYVDFRRAFMNLPEENTEPLCTNGIDDDLDGAVNCADSSCSATVACAPPEVLNETACTDGTADLCCSNGKDDDFDGVQDCDDSDCQGVASMCTVAWLKTKFGNVYAQEGIAAIAAPAAQYNATYCLSRSTGDITGFASQQGCLSTVSSPLTLPSSGSGYKGSLGTMDVVGIRNGRYGQVVPIANGNAVPEFLDGKIYRYTGGGTLVLPSQMFRNGIGSTGRGNGLLFVDGADLRISGDLTYAEPTVDNYLRNLASFGVIVTADPATGSGGNILIDPTVRNVVGALFAERSISTGVSANNLQALGLFASRLINLQRTGGTVTDAAETVIFDGRAVANPPPGMQDVGKSLPTVKEAF
jgi:hypothetical protein